jgi:Endonuclease NucS
MAIIPAGTAFQFRTEADLEEWVWRNLPALLNLQPLSRQFAIDGKFCDILAVESPQKLAIIELKNTEDRYIIQQLTRYYDAIKVAKDFLFDVDRSQSIRLIAIAPRFHLDTLTDCKYSTLKVELFTFQLEQSAKGLNLILCDADGLCVGMLPLSSERHSSQTDIQISEPPRKLLNWLSHSSNVEHEWILQLRKQLLGFDPRMKEIVEPTQITYGRGKSKPCCELRKNTTGGLTAQKITYFLWLPDPENKPHIIKMHMHFDFEKRRVKSMAYGRRGYRSGSPWVRHVDEELWISAIARAIPTFPQWEDGHFLYQCCQSSATNLAAQILSCKEASHGSKLNSTVVTP